jgi:SnoaL-like domain
MSTTEATLAAIERFNDASISTMSTADEADDRRCPVREHRRSAFRGQEAVCEFFRRFFETTPMAWFDTEDVFAVGDRGVLRWTLSFNRESRNVVACGVWTCSASETVGSPRSSRT